MECVTAAEANKFLAEDSNRISGKIARSLAINSPWINVIETGTFAAGVSDTQRSVVQQAVAPVLSQATPNWSSFACNTNFNTIEVGSTEYQYTPEEYKEKGPVICVETAYSSFRNAIRMTEMAISDHTQTLWNSWIRFKMFRLAANKVTANATVAAAQGFSGILATGLNTNFKAGVAPTSPISFKFLKYLANYLTHSVLAGPEFQWGTGMFKHFRFISDQTTVDAMRAEADVRSDLRYIAAGQNADARNALLSYSWEGPYQGIAFGVDQSILRANGYNATTGAISFVEPFLSQETTNGVMRIVNPDWLSAPYQVSFIMARNSVFREIPEEFLGEGMTKFERQNWAGKVTWHNQPDNNCNIEGNRGFHYYKLAAAMRPERPEFIIPILHTRCPDDFGLTNCTPQGYYTLST